MTSHSEPDELRRAVRMLWAAFGRKADDETCAVWAQSLRPHVSTTLWRVFRESAESKTLPNLGEILGKVRAITQSNAGSPLHILTPDERRRSDRNAILSMLWLHYSEGWRFEDFAGTVFERNFGKDPVTALTAAAELYDKETVLRWMKDQKAAGN